jgi:outer membrane receptor protein involved in Fe transport
MKTLKHIRKKMITILSLKEKFNLHHVILIILVLFLPDNVISEEENIIDDIVVVGSRINNERLIKILPVTIIRSEEIELLGIDSGDDLIASLVEQGTNKFNDAGNAIAGVNSARGDMGAFNLRNMGTGNTLVLLNGRRLINSPSFQSESVGGSFVPVNSVNTNTLPVRGIERLEILRDGSSAIYGADAVAGVINVVTKKNIEGFALRVKATSFENFNRSDSQINFEYGSNFNSGNTKLSLIYSYYDRDPVKASEDERMGISNWRDLPQIAGTKWDTTRFRRSSINSPYGQFDVERSVKGFRFFNEQGLTDKSGEFEIFPDTEPKCLVDLKNGACIAADTSTKRYNLNTERWVISDLSRNNLQVNLSHDFTGGVRGFTELSYYSSETKQNNSPSTTFSSSKLIVPESNYWNPFGVKFLPDGTINPNRLNDSDAMGIPDEGLAIIMDNYRFVDVGPRRVNVEKDTYRLLQGFRGAWKGWDWETALFISKASSDDITSNRLSNTLVEESLSLSSPQAYNPFNGGGNYDDYLLYGKDQTSSGEGSIENAIIDVYRKGERELKGWDLRLENLNFLQINSGFIALVTGIEFREDSFKDDRDPRLDGTIQYTDSDGDTYPFVSDVINSSPTPDNSGKRDVFSAFIELAIPLISNEMNIPFVRSLDVQLAGRYEDFSDIGSKAVPKIGIGWQVDDEVMFRGSWSKGFRAPNLIQINESIGARQIYGVDALLCLQQINNNGTIDYCDYSLQKIARGSGELKAEESTNFSIGVVYEPKSIRNLIFTLDWWKIEKEDTIGLFGEDNIMLTDLVLRMESNNLTDCSLVQSSPFVFREDPDEGQIEDYLNAGICPAGRVSRVEESYQNLDTRILSGFDVSLYYSLKSSLGNFKFALNIAKLEEFKQQAGNDFIKLIDAQEKNIIPKELAISGFSDLLEKDGSPEMQASIRFLWSNGPLGLGFFAKHVGEFYETRNRLSDGTLWKVEDYNTINGHIDYNLNVNYANSRIRLGINNITDERAPLASDIFGYYFDKHDNLGRYYYIDLSYKF